MTFAKSSQRNTFLDKLLTSLIFLGKTKMVKMIITNIADWTVNGIIFAPARKANLLTNIWIAQKKEKARTLKRGEAKYFDFIL